MEPFYQRNWAGQPQKVIFRIKSSYCTWSTPGLFFFAFKPMYSQYTWVYHILDLCHISKEVIPFLFKGIHFIVCFCYILFVQKFYLYVSFESDNAKFFCVKFAFVNIIFCSSCYKMYQCLGTRRKYNSLNVELYTNIGII